MSVAAGDAAPGHASAAVVVFVREGCHLCDEAGAVVTRVCAETGDDHLLLDVDDHDDAADAAGVFDDELPVTFVHGERHDYWRVDPDRLRAALLGRRE